MGVSDEQLKYVRDNFERKYAEQITGGSYDDRDLRRLRTDDVYVMTFIRGPQRLDEGVDLVHESLKFRKEYGVNDLTKDSFEQWVWDKHAVFFHGHTKTGHKILFLRVKEHKKDASQLPLVKKFVVFWLEMAFRAKPLEPVVTMFDMSEAGLSNLDMEFIRFILTCFKLYYPTFLEKLLIYEMPWIFNAAWKVIKTWLSAEAIAKIKFATRSDIHNYIDNDQLFEHMGGICDMELVDFCPSYSEDGTIVFSDPADRRRVTFSDITDSQQGRLSLNLNNNASHRLTSPRPHRHRRHVSTGSESSFPGRLLTISPADELSFVVDEESREAFDVITLTNTLVYPIGFKVKTTAPEKYRVRPSTGVVKPGEAFEVYVYLQPGYINTVEKDKFLVMAMEVSGDNYDTSLWKTAPKDTIMEHRLRCVAPGQADFNANVSVDGEGASITIPPTSTHVNSKPIMANPYQSQMDLLLESNYQLRRTMRWLIVSQVVFFILLLFFFAAFFCLGEDLFSSYLYFPFGYCVANSWSRRC